MKKIGFIVAFSFIIAWAANPVLALQRRLEQALVKNAPVAAQSLTLREQVGQTIMPRLNVGQQDYFKDSVLNGEVTGFFIKSPLPFQADFWQTYTPEQAQQVFAQERAKLIQTIEQLQAWAKQSRHRIPLLFAFDYEGGQITSPMYIGLKQAPSNMLLGASTDLSVITQMYDAIAKELQAVGGNVAFGPVTDVNSNPRNPIIQARSFGGNSAEVGIKAALAVQALQRNHIPAFSKHFPGHGDTDSDTHLGETHMDMPLTEVMSKHIAAFIPSIQAGVKGVMSAHVMYASMDKGVNASLSPKILKNILQNKLGFTGVIATDGLDMGAISGMEVEDIVRRAYKAGNHLLLLTSSEKQPQDAPLYAKRAADFVQRSVNLPGENEVTAQEIAHAAQQVLELKKWMGLFEKQQATPAQDTGFEKAARRAAEEGVTLVRGEGALIKEAQKVCSIFFVTPIFQEQVKTFNTYLTKRGKSVQTLFMPQELFGPAGEAKELERLANEPVQKQITALKEKAHQCIAAADVTVIGTMGNARSENMISQFTMVNYLLSASFKPTVLLSLVTPYEIPLYPQADTVLALYGPTVDTVTVSAQILLGERKAKGKLPVDFSQPEGRIVLRHTEQ